MVRRNATDTWRFVCLTDDPVGIRSDVGCFPCPEMGILISHRIRGWR